MVDALDLKLLQALQLDGRAPFSRIAAVLGVSDQTVARRFRRLRESAAVRIIGVTDENTLGRSSWMVRLDCMPDAAERLADALARRADTTYVALISGGTEVICAMKPRSQRDRDDLLLDRLPRTPRVVGVRASCLVHYFFGGRFSWLEKAGALTGEQIAALRPEPLDPQARTPSLTPDDEKLLRVLRQDGRAPLSDLQAAVGQSEDVVRRRLDRLIAGGVLYFDVQYEPEGLGQDIGAMIWLTVTPSAVDAAGRALAAHPQTELVAAVTGRQNMVVSVRCRDTAGLYEFLHAGLGALDGVQNAETALVLRQVKQLVL